MNGALVVMCVAAFGLVSVGVSLLVGVSMPLCERLRRSLSPHQQVWFWSALGMAPAGLGGLAVIASVVSAWGGYDHCVGHGPHHPHL